MCDINAVPDCTSDALAPPRCGDGRAEMKTGIWVCVFVFGEQTGDHVCVSNTTGTEVLEHTLCTRVAFGGTRSPHDGEKDQHKSIYLPEI